MRCLGNGVCYNSARGCRYTIQFNSKRECVILDQQSKPIATGRESWKGMAIEASFTQGRWIAGRTRQGRVSDDGTALMWDDSETWTSTPQAIAWMPYDGPLVDPGWSQQAMREPLPQAEWNVQTR